MFKKLQLHKTLGGVKVYLNAFLKLVSFSYTPRQLYARIMAFGYKAGRTPQPVRKLLSKEAYLPIPQSFNTQTIESSDVAHEGWHKCHGSLICYCDVKVTSLSLKKNHEVF